MSYLTQTELLDYISERELINLTDDADTGQIDTAKVTQAIEDAESMVDAYLGARYTVPLTSPPAIIKKAVAVITIFSLQVRREEVPDARKDEYEKTIKFLQLLAAGKVTLGEVPSPEENPERATAQIQSADRIFSREELDEW